MTLIIILGYFFFWILSIIAGFTALGLLILLLLWLGKEYPEVLGWIIAIACSSVASLSVASSLYTTSL
ncbi:MAG: hypothetical protein AAB337_03730 [Patescibacteria group bacterium]